MSAKSPRRLRNTLVVLLILAVLYIAYRLTLHWMVEARLDEIRKQGYPVTLSELDKWYPQVPADENAANVYEEAFSHFTEGKYEQLKLLPLPYFYAKLLKRDEPLPTVMKQTISDYLTTNAETLARLHKAAGMKLCRYPTDFSGGYDWNRRSGGIFRNHFSQSYNLFFLEAIRRAENNEPELTTQSLLAMLGLARSLAKAPIPHIQVARIVFELRMVQLLERCLCRTQLTDEQLHRLKANLEQIEAEESVLPEFIGERCFGIDAAAHGFWPIQCGGHDDVWPVPFVYGFEGNRRIIEFLYRVTGVAQWDEINYLNIMAAYVAASQLPFPDLLARNQTLKAKVNRLLITNILSLCLTRDAQDVLVCEARQVARLRAAQAALAIECHRLALGSLPEKLDDLIPKYLTHPISDPFTNQPLRYKKLAKGYVVYSVGEDGKDDGGDEKKDITFVVER